MYGRYFLGARLQAVRRFFYSFTKYSVQVIFYLSGDSPLCRPYLPVPIGPFHLFFPGGRLFFYGPHLPYQLRHKGFVMNGL